jgi:cytochrome P450
LVTASGQDGSPEASYDPMRQFAELAGDVRDPYPMFAGIRADMPVMEVHFGPESGGGSQVDQQAPRITSLFTVTSDELAQQVLTDNERFSSAVYATTIGHVMGPSILEMDPPEHLRHRALVARAFRARVLDQWSDTIIGATISELIDAFALEGHADLIPQLTFPFPVRVIARILGLPESDWPRFLRLSTELIAVMRNRDRAVAASRELRGYFAEIIADRRRNTRDDLVSQLIEAEIDGRRLSDDEIYPFLLLLLPAGAETTYRSSSNLLFGLLAQPDLLDTVRTDRDLVPQAIEEALRWETPLLTVARTATRDVELGGVRIPSGGFVAVSLGAANRDPGRYPDPDAFDIFREDKQHVSFGDGAHKCLGMHLARLEMRILLSTVLDRLPGLRLDPGAEDPHIHGLLFRSPPNLPVRFDPA